jgi:formate dehydrogenase subunit beta
MASMGAIRRLQAVLTVDLILIERFAAQGTDLFMGLCANFMGTAMLLGDLPPQMLHSVSKIEFSGFIWHMGRPSSFFILLLAYLFTCAFFYWKFRKDYASIKMDLACMANENPLDHIKDKPFAIAACSIFILTIVAMAFRQVFGFHLGFIAMWGALGSILFFTLFLVEERKRVLPRGQEKDRRPVALVVKGCDSRAVNVLFQEHILKRSDLILVGMPCRGVVDPQSAEELWRQRTESKDSRRVCVTNEGLVEIDDRNRETRFAGLDEVMAPQCRVCTHRNPIGCDEQIWDNLEERVIADKDRYVQVDKLRTLQPSDRWKFWKEQFSRCIRCNACKDICPLCYCDECTIAKDCEQSVGADEKARKTFWIDKEVCLSNNTAFHMHRAMHLAGRCVDCGECERACPAGIPLRLLYNGVERAVEERFHYTSGLARDGVPVLATYSETDAEDFIEG